MEPDDERQRELIEDLLADRAPAIPGGLTEEEAELAQTVALLKSVRPEALHPDPAFVESLRGRLFDPASHAPDGTPPTGAGEAAAAPPHRLDAAPRKATRAFSRRRLLGALAGGAAAGLALGAAAGRAAAQDEANVRVEAAEQKARDAEQRALDAQRAETTPYHVPLIGSLGQWQTIVADYVLAPGEARQFTQGALIFYLLRDNEGGYSAVSATCTHMGCLLTWQAGGRNLLCPCHGSAYDERGRVISGVARHPLPHIQVRVHDGQVQVWTIGADASESGVPPYTVP